jgi:glutaredoxin domain-containing cysteine-rich protein 1
MGCTGSRHALRGGVRGGSRSPRARSRSGGVHHTVALKSSTLGSLSLDRDRDDDGALAGAAKTLMRRQKQQVRGSPAKAPAREPEVINVWELMDGLDDDGKDDEEGGDADADAEGRREKSATGSPAEFDFDPDVIAAFRKALDENPPPPPSDVPGNEGCVDKKPDGPGGEVGVKVKQREREIQRFPGIVRARVSAFQQRIDAKLLAKLAPPPPPPDSARKVVLYLTSLRGVRKTYEDCWSTRSVLRSYGVRVDERDLSMHSGFKDELHAALGSSPNNAGRLPQAFADGRHLGGAEEVRRMHEAGELARALEACDVVVAPPPSSGGKGVVLDACSGCGGVRFVPCEDCSGSCKVFVEEVATFRRCPECNENGLVRCPLCSS